MYGFSVSLGIFAESFDILNKALNQQTSTISIFLSSYCFQQIPTMSFKTILNKYQANNTIPRSCSFNQEIIPVLRVYLSSATMLTSFQQSVTITIIQLWQISERGSRLKLFVAVTYQNIIKEDLSLISYIWKEIGN